MAGETVLVTGASGYIAGFVIRELVARGYRVRGTVRSPGRAAEVRASLGLTEVELPLVVADLNGDAGWEEAMAGCNLVQHIASPFAASVPRHEDEMIVPARDGALRALRFAKAAGVRRVVMTSSTAAVTYGRVPPGRAYTEADWTDPSEPDVQAYVKSKTIAERAARDWMARHGAGMEFVTVNPSLVLGPLLSADHSPSLEVVIRLLSGTLPGLPRVGFPVVDVRDVADAHLKAMETTGINGARFLATGPFLWLADVARLLRRHLGPKARRVPVRPLPDWLVRLAALVDPQVRMVLPELGRVRACDSSHARQVLGWSTRPVEQTITDCARSLIDMGLVRA